MSNAYTLVRPKSLFGIFIIIPVFGWWLLDLFFVARWVREHNAAIGRQG